jgi:hypothetical protein
VVGAGGEEGRGKALEEGRKQEAEARKYSMERSAQEQHMAQFSAELANAQRQTDFQNAKLLWDVKFQNEKMIYDSELQKYGLDQPKVTNTAGGLAIQQTDPATGHAKLTFQPTDKTHAEHLESAIKMIKSLGGDPTPYELQYIYDTSPDPVQRMHRVERKAIEHIVGSGQGVPIFGKEYDKAAKAVDARLQSDPTWPMMNTPTKIGEAHQLRDQHIIDELHNKFRNSGNESWKQQLLQSPDSLAQIVGGAQQLPPVQ